MVKTPAIGFAGLAAVLMCLSGTVQAQVPLIACEIGLDQMPVPASQGDILPRGCAPGQVLATTGDSPPACRFERSRPLDSLTARGPDAAQPEYGRSDCAALAAQVLSEH